MIKNPLHIIPFSWHMVKILPCLLLFAISACTDNIDYPDNINVPEGKPATISIGVDVEGMTKLTRAEGVADYNRVASLWVGIFNSNSGEMTGGGMMTEKDNGFKVGNDHQKYTLSNINTKSGKSYIVGVANPENYNAITVGNTTPRNLKGILEKEVTDWNSYKSIVITETRVQGNAVDIQTPSVDNDYGLVMSGIYATDDASHPINEEKPVAINADANNLTGAIHLRLLQSHIKFNLQAKGNVVELTPQSYQVHNIPSSSWLHEHVNSGEILNSGDALLGNKFDKDKNPDYYGSSLRFTSTSFTKEEVKNEAGENVTSYTFDFWQMENKRTGLESCQGYQYREKEYGKNGEYEPTGETAAYEPSGLFMSLTPFDNPTLNNMATYVDIPCVVKYREKTTEGNAKPGQITSDPDNLLDPGATRTANITYRIHLGYVTPDKNPRDFNTYRNSDYTYNVTVSDLHNVIVEAFRVDESQPGGFGDVTDVSDKFFTLDAHYGVFNIKLSEEDLEKFSFRIVSYDDNAPHEIIMGAPNKTDTEITDDNRKYYNWITLLPTNSEDMSVLAKYPEDKSTLLHLKDFLPITNENGEKEASRTAGIYTVFVNEYVYEDGPDETGGNWKRYVNQPDRMLWINVAQKTSADGESVFYKAKYAVAQRSIQTYYNTTSSTSQNAIGVEHENENLGMNLRWTIGTDQLNPNNGRWNVWSKLNNKSWNQYVDPTKWQNVNRINNPNIPLSYTTEQTGGGYRNVTMMETINPSQLTNTLGNHPDYNYAASASASIYDPQNYDPKDNNAPASQFIQAMYACMNRNRDENGNGIIEPSELKWYLPASGKYLRVIIGRNSLSTPIMNYINNENLPYTTKAQNAFFLLASSDNKVIWAVEGMSSSSFSGTSYCAPPWQVRCIRNLGTNLANEIQNSNDDGVTPAYSETINGTGAIIKVSSYYGTSLRDPRTTPLPVHKTSSEYNRLSRYGFEVAYVGNSITDGSESEEEIPGEAKYTSTNFKKYLEGTLTVANPDNGLTETIAPCKDLNSGDKKGWRVPNQKELAIILRLENYNFLRFQFLSYCTSCTVEHWDDEGKSPADIDLGKFRMCDAYATWADQWTISGHSMGANSFGEMSFIRCVRDLQQGEYPELNK